MSSKAHAQQEAPEPGKRKPAPGGVEEAVADTEPAAASVEGDELTLEDRGLAIAYRCRLLREQGRAAIVEATAERAGTRWRPLLLPVAKRLRDTLGELLEHIPQDGLVDGLVAHDPIVLNQVEGILTQDLGSLLTIMGYTPPPAQDVLTVDLLDAVHEYTIAATRTGGILTNTTDVYTSIYAFKYNLSRLITECERDESPAAAPVDERHLQAAVLSAVGTGCDALLPGMIAAAGIAIVFPPAGTAAAAHILVGAAGGAAAKDALGRTLKGAAGYVTGKWLKGSRRGPTRTCAPRLSCWPTTCG